MSLAEYRYICINVQQGKIVYGSNDLDLVKAKAEEYHMNGGAAHVIAETLFQTRLKKMVDLVVSDI